MAGAEEIWVCANCRSVNKLRAKQCYNCRTPKEWAAVDPSSEHVGSRQVSLPEFRPSRPYAILASVLILVIGTVQAMNSLISASLAFRFAEGSTVTEDEIVNTLAFGLTTIGIGLIALTAWALWLSKVVRVMTALGLGYPAANGLMAFIENFIPFLNLWRVPAIVRDVVVRLEPNESKGGALIFAAWIGLIAGYLLPRVGGVVAGLGSETEEDLLRNGALTTRHRRAWSSSGRSSWSSSSGGSRSGSAGAARPRLEGAARRPRPSPRRPRPSDGRRRPRHPRPSLA
jgi:hypothetical protein